ncbi:tetratricopeptide repeat protein [Oceanicoccus sagamiensis]|uniref:Uncharacterized protein n=1 Tax=Oceanicoccus sagamiensis TaxID=716816 RepID=A0A1X9NEG6_9GAMM|nr:tetratricopeptide repeat protein [Oceanicoccus sagamiensis]ARN73939.1 hypothetical protein BST96_07310 [Oceanicoccus sagamiensis]
MKEHFDLIHDLLKRKEYDSVLDLIFNPKLFVIESPYCEDLNHAWFIVGDIFYKKGSYEKAISSFKKSLDDWPEDIEAMLALANCYSEVSLPKKVEELLKKAKSIAPENGSISYNLANSLFDQGEYLRAISLYKEVDCADIEIYEMAKKNIKKSRAMLKKKSSDSY